MKTRDIIKALCLTAIIAVVPLAAAAAQPETASERQRREMQDVRNTQVQQERQRQEMRDAHNGRTEQQRQEILNTRGGQSDAAPYPFPSGATHPSNVINPNGPDAR